MRIGASVFLTFLCALCIQLQQVEAVVVEVGLHQIIGDEEGLLTGGIGGDVVGVEDDGHTLGVIEHAALDPVQHRFVVVAEIGGVAAVLNLTGGSAGTRPPPVG